MFSSRLAQITPDPANVVQVVIRRSGDVVHMGFHRSMCVHYDADVSCNSSGRHLVLTDE